MALKRRNSRRWRFEGNPSRRREKMRMLLGGEWVDREERIEVVYPYDGSVVDTVPEATEEDVRRAIDLAIEGQRDMERLTAYERYRILFKVSELLERNLEELAVLLTKEVGKTVRESRIELGRAVQTYRWCAEEAKRVCGETVAFDAFPGGETKVGFYIRVPAGVVAAITPFNFPVNLAAHKIGPALGVGNAVVHKPSSLTPLTSLRIGEFFLEAGLPPKALSVLTMTGGSPASKALLSDPRIRILSFTGGTDTAKEIISIAGYKKLFLELGGNCPVIVMDDADLERAAGRVVAGGYSLAGQVCNSVQRVYVHKKVYDDFLSILVDKVKALKVGDPLDPQTDVGPMISERAAERAERWVAEAVDKGAKLHCGGSRLRGALFKPTVLSEVHEGCTIMCREAFAPVVLVNPISDLEEGIEKANNSIYGLQAGIFTNRLGDALKAVRRLQFGGVFINEVSQFRVDQMPYGGVKWSGMGREGIKFAMEEMTEIRVVGIELGEAF